MLFIDNPVALIMGQSREGATKTQSRARPHLCQEDVDDLLLILSHLLLRHVLLGEAGDLLGNLGLTLLWSQRRQSSTSTSALFVRHI